MVRLDLPARLARVLPRWLTELLIAVSVTGLFVGGRMTAVPLLGDHAPFALCFLAMVLAALLAGWRSGAISLLLGTALVWYFILPPRQSFAIEDAATALTLGVVILSQMLILLAIAIYQREVRAGALERARRINFLGHALKEMDHRTKNNFQIVTSLLAMQGARSSNAEVKAALAEAAERLKAVAAVYAALAPSSQGLGVVRLHDQLQEICNQIRRGFLPDSILLDTEFEPMLVPNEVAISIGIIVNELVTNACKHAFPDGGGTILVRAVKDGGDALIEVADSGKGLGDRPNGKNGLGTRLVGAFVQRTGGRADVRSSPGGGTIHSIRIPLHTA